MEEEEEEQRIVEMRDEDEEEMEEENEKGFFVRPDENAFQFFTKTKFLPLKNFFEIPPLSHLFSTEGFHPGDVLEVFCDDLSYSPLFMYKILISFLLPSFIVNKDSRTKRFCPVITFKEEGREDDVKILYFDNCKMFSHQVFLDMFETAIYNQIRKSIFQVNRTNEEEEDDDEEETIFNVFGGEKEYRDFVVNCLEKFHLKLCPNVRDFRYSLELLRLSWRNGPKYRVVMVDNINAFYQRKSWNTRKKENDGEFRNLTNPNEDWECALQILKEMARKRLYSLVLSRVPKFRKKKKNANNKASKFIAPFRVFQIYDDFCEYYSKNWLMVPTIQYKVVMQTIENKNFLVMKKGDEELIKRVYEFMLDRNQKTIVFKEENFGDREIVF